MMKTRALRYTTGNRKKEATTMSTRRMDDLKAAEKMWLKSPDLYEKGHMAGRRYIHGPFAATGTDAAVIANALASNVRAPHEGAREAFIYAAIRAINEERKSQGMLRTPKLL